MSLSNMERYKKKSLRFSGCGLSKAVRALEHNESRKSSRSELLNVRRNIKVFDDSLVSTPEPVKNTTIKGIPKPLSRLEQLKKWRDEKALKKKVEEKKKPPPFVVGSLKHKNDTWNKPNSMNYSTLNCTKIANVTSKNISVLHAAKHTSIIPKNVSALHATKNSSIIPKNVSTSHAAKNTSIISKNVSTLHAAKNTSIIPKNTSSALSKVQKDHPGNQAVKLQKNKQQVSIGVPKVPVSRIPSVKPPQVGHENSRLFQSRIPSSKPSVQKVGVSENVPPVGFKNTQSKIGMLQKPSANINKKVLGLGFNNSKVPIEGKKVDKKVAQDEKIKKEPSRRLSFAPENFKFVPDLPMVDLSIFEGLNFARKTDSIMRVSTPIKATPPLSSSKNEECIKTPVQSNDCHSITEERADVKETEDMTKIKEVDGKENADENESTFDNIANDKEIGNKNVTRRTTKLKNKFTFPEFEPDVECISGMNIPKSFPLFNIIEEFENGTPCDTPKSHKSPAVRRSLRLLEKSTPKKTLAASLLSEAPVKGNPVSICDTDVSEALSQLNMNAINESPKLEQPVKKEKKPKKVSLLYTPEQKRYSLRRSVRGDLISFS